MKQQHILKYSISLLFVLFTCITTRAQNDSIATTETSTPKVKLRYGLRLGGDAIKLARSFFDDDYKGFQVNGDYRITKDWYIAGELGSEEQNTVSDFLNVTTSGSYFKAGADYNVYENWLDMDNLIYFGFRVGASSFSQKLNSYTTYTTNQYWEPNFSSITAEEFKGLTAIWVELIAGFKAEILPNIYVSAGVELKRLITNKTPNNFDNLYIPGYNKTSDTSKFGTGYNYSISYLIPLYKKGK